jgi:hypothetical protein
VSDRNDLGNLSGLFVFPAKAGIQGSKTSEAAPDPRFREAGDTLPMILA